MNQEQNSVAVTKDLVIVGAGGLAREVAVLLKDLVDHGAKWNLLGFIGEAGVDAASTLKHGPILGGDDWLRAFSEPVNITIAVGAPKIRARIGAGLNNANFCFPNLIHPSVHFRSEELRWGVGNIIMAGCALTSDIKLQDFNYVGVNSTLGHDVCIGSYSALNPGCNISGNVIIGDGVLVGTGAQVLQGLRIGARSVVGAGAVVTRDIDEGQTVVGIPAKPLLGKRA